MDVVNFTFTGGSSVPSPPLSQVVIVDDDVVEDNSENIEFSAVIAERSSGAFPLLTQTGGNMTIQDNDGKIKSCLTQFSICSIIEQFITSRILTLYRDYCWISSLILYC